MCFLLKKIKSSAEEFIKAIVFSQFNIIQYSDLANIIPSISYSAKIVDRE